MEMTINNTTIDLTTKEGRIFANTKDIADVFEKENSNIMKKVKLLPDYEELVTEAKINGGYYTDENGQQREMIELDRDIFSVIVMGFTGTKAYQWKRAYIGAFNEMEQELLNPLKLTPLGEAEVYMVKLSGLVKEERTKKELTQKILSTATTVFDNTHENMLVDNIGMQELCQILTSRATEVIVGRTTLYSVMRSMKLITKDGRKPTQYGNSYLDYRHSEHGYSIRIPEDRIGKLISAIIKHLLNNNDMNEALGYPFHPELRD